jgi:nucleoside-diphosphate-sugar epimerase
MAEPLLLITGATGKVGRHFLRAATEAPKLAPFRFRALCHKRTLPEHDRVDVVNGSISERDLVHHAMQDVTHVVHLATCKETPEDVMDVTVKGLFWLLEEARISQHFQQFIIIGGDACVGHFHYPHTKPVTESHPYAPYPGCYALSKVLEEVLLEQYYRPYDLNGCCLRAPWIMEKDDFKYQLSFGPDVFGAPVWSNFVDEAAAHRYAESQTVPVMLDPDGIPVSRNFVHVSDLVSAIVCAIDHPKARQQLFNISMDSPVDYQELANYLQETRGLPQVPIQTAHHSTWLDNSKAKHLLGWSPSMTMQSMADEAFDYAREPDDPRVIHYPG